ncbi:MAG: hypothetical protein CFK49_10880 [Armatimonadetes bacterium JP3_11]|jgi:hypothetical protein|nr:MAG: hypothetical protein CFK48_10485 [Armatimonadetes bacterium CP1_7O]OYT72471.1 MAG: hypothetical protein CFK49_10880 [Armatimonadetes bacterium JP3_11]RMH09564.1 MAG: hypothetical protein D6697_03220 [Armatimonadota bacterium]
MARWAIRTAQLLSVLWATLFLAVSLLHPLAHNPMQHDGSDCLVCVLQQTHSPQPTPTLSEALSLPEQWRESATLLVRDTTAHRAYFALEPSIPRAPPA